MENLHSALADSVYLQHIKHTVGAKGRVAQTGIQARQLFCNQVEVSWWVFQGLLSEIMGASICKRPPEEGHEKPGSGHLARLFWAPNDMLDLSFWGSDAQEIGMIKDKELSLWRTQPSCHLGLWLLPGRCGKI